MRLMILRTLITSSGITALGFVNSVLLSRWLGPVGRGEIAAAMLWPGLLIYISSMGLIVSSMYFTSPPDSKPQVVLNNAIILGLMLSCIALPISFMLLPWLLKSQTADVVSASRLYLAVIPLSLINQFGLGVLQGRLRISELNWLRTVIPVGYLLGTVLFMALGRLTLANIIVLHLGLNATAMLCTLATLARSGIYPGFQTDTALARQMLSYGAKVHVGQISGLANVSLDQVLIAAWLPPAYLGLYVIAVSSAGLSQLFSGAVQTVTMPGIAQKESVAERGALLQDVFRRYWLLSILMMLTLGAILPFVIPIVFGAAFKPSVWPAEILLLASLFMGAKQVLGGGAVALGNPWLGSKANLIALAVTVVLLSALLPVIGIMGAAIATTAAYSVELAVVIYGLRSTHSISPVSLFKIKIEDLSLALQSIGVKVAPRGI
jgi:O-antigen/teichoic acid export membrane protein